LSDEFGDPGIRPSKIGTTLADDAVVCIAGTAVPTPLGALLHVRSLDI
jgi:hypothetical protein